MKKTLLITILSAMMGIGAAYGQSFTFDDGGMYGGTATSGFFNSNDTFTLTLNLTFSGFNSVGFSLWLETVTSLAPNLTITGEDFTGGLWTDPTDNPNDYDTANGFSPFPKAFNDGAGADGGFLSSRDTLGHDAMNTTPATGDLGATGASKAPGGPFLLAHITFSLNGALPGMYTLQSTGASPKISEITEASNFNDHAGSMATYTINIVPEPSTAALIALTLAGVGVIAHRRRALRG